MTSQLKTILFVYILNIVKYYRNNEKLHKLGYIQIYEVFHYYIHFILLISSFLIFCRFLYRLSYYSIFSQNTIHRSKHFK